MPCSQRNRLRHQILIITMRYAKSLNNLSGLWLKGSPMDGFDFFRQTRLVLSQRKKRSTSTNYIQVQRDRKTAKNFGSRLLGRNLSVVTNLASPLRQSKHLLFLGGATATVAKPAPFCPLPVGVQHQSKAVGFCRCYQIFRPMPPSPNFQNCLWTMKAAWQHRQTREHH
jgi:hypothetical protein